MELRQLRCFIAVADALHFGRAAQQLDMLPSALGRHIRLLEESLNVRLFVRSTRNVALTAHGHKLLEEGKQIVADVDALEVHFRRQGRLQARTLRIGAIDSAAIALVPHLLPTFRHACPDVDMRIDENKTAQLLPKLKSGQLDMAFIRPLKERDPQLTTRFLLYENVVLAIAEHHPLATRHSVTIEDIATLPLIVPARRARAHSHDVTIKQFYQAGLKPHIVQLVDEKQTILSMVASEVGGAIMPRWAARMATPHVRFVTIDHGEGAFTALPLAVAWVGNAPDAARDTLLEIVSQELPHLIRQLC
ncbi:LysR substrate-binding domain-containing protein [Symbiopectobacterium sp. Eva_TO]